VRPAGCIGFRSGTLCGTGKYFLFEIAIAIGIGIKSNRGTNLNRIDFDFDFDFDPDSVFAGGTGNSLPVLRSNKRILLKTPFVPMKAETPCPLWLTSLFVENLLAFGHRHQCRWHPGKAAKRYRYRVEPSTNLNLIDFDPDFDFDPWRKIIVAIMLH
jgi:hypothetical protein